MWKLAACVIALLLSACNSSPVTPKAVVPPSLASDITAQESIFTNWLNDYGNISNFTLMLESTSGNAYSHSVGNSSPGTVYESASASKWVAAVVILDAVERGYLSLTDNPQNYIAGWPTTGNLANITLLELLNFTSNLQLNHACLTVAATQLVSCVNALLEVNKNTQTVSGTELYYGPVHLQVAGLMAVNAINQSNRSISSWMQLFADFKTRYGVFSQSHFNIPSLHNPRLAGGMEFRADEYMVFLKKLHNHQILSENRLITLRTAYGANATIVESPAADISQTWRYGFGVWLEDCTTVSVACVSDKISSPGAYGAYPFIDFENGYWGILARQGSLNSFSSSYRLMNAANGALENWAQLANP